jgi:protein-L-isoaspartate(D-aspartate) O-methyltransferase
MDFGQARDNMVDSQIRPNDVTDPGIVAAFLRTPRELFVPEARRGVAYSELEIATSPGRALWTPRDTAKLIRLASIQPADNVLVVGAGAGYEAALISLLAANVSALEETDDLISAMGQRFAAIGAERATPLKGPIADGWPGLAPFDVIYVAGMIETLPGAWTDQLGDGGRLVAVMAEAGGVGRGKVFTRSGSNVSAREGFDAYPPRFTGFDRKPAFSF